MDHRSKFGFLEWFSTSARHGWFVLIQGIVGQIKLLNLNASTFVFDHVIVLDALRAFQGRGELSTEFRFEFQSSVHVIVLIAAFTWIATKNFLACLMSLRNRILHIIRVGPSSEFAAVRILVVQSVSASVWDRHPGVIHVSVGERGVTMSVNSNLGQCFASRIEIVLIVHF